MRRQGSISATVDVEVPFHDVDMVGIVWHGHHLKYLENARWAVMNRIGFGLQAMAQSGYLWPIISVQMKYVRAARFGDRLRVQASLVEWESRLTLNYLITDCRDGARVGRAQTTQVAVDKETGVMQFTSPQCLLDCVRAASG